MPQFAVHRNVNSETDGEFPLLVDVQADLLAQLQTRVVVPLAKSTELTEFPMAYLAPVIRFEGESYTLMTPQMAGIALAALGPQAGSVADQQRAILTALEFLIRGFA